MVFGLRRLMHISLCQNAQEAYSLLRCDYYVKLLIEHTASIYRESLFYAFDLLRFPLPQLPGDLLLVHRQAIHPHADSVIDGIGNGGRGGDG